MSARTKRIEPNAIKRNFLNALDMTLESANGLPHLKGLKLVRNVRLLKKSGAFCPKF
jgi:hypothetical protein